MFRRCLLRRLNINKFGGVDPTEKKQVVREGCDHITGEFKLDYKTLRKPPKWYNTALRSIKNMEDTRANNTLVFLSSGALTLGIFYLFEKWIAPTLDVEFDKAVQESTARVEAAKKKQQELTGSAEMTTEALTKLASDEGKKKLESVSKAMLEPLGFFPQRGKASDRLFLPEDAKEEGQEQSSAA